MQNVAGLVWIGKIQKDPNGRREKRPSSNCGLNVARRRKGRRRSK